MGRKRRFSAKKTAMLLSPCIVSLLWKMFGAALQKGAERLLSSVYDVLQRMDVRDGVTTVLLIGIAWLAAGRWSDRRRIRWLEKVICEKLEVSRPQRPSFVGKVVRIVLDLFTVDTEKERQDDPKVAGSLAGKS